MEQLYKRNTLQLQKAKGKECGTRPLKSKPAMLISVSRPFSQEVQWGVRGHPVLSHTLPTYLSQISLGMHFELERLWASLQSHATDPPSQTK